MSPRLVPVWAIAFLTLAGPSVRAQAPFPTDLVPTRTALSRVGLERQWMATVPLTGAERVLRISRSENLLFAQTNHAALHTFDVQTGQHLWSAELGERAPFARPVSSNSFAVFATNANILIALERNTGRLIWKVNLETIPTSGTVCDEERVMVGMTTGKLLSYSLKEKTAKGGDQIRSKPVLQWNWQTGGPITCLPLPAQRIVAFGGGDNKAYVALANSQTMLFRVATGGPIGEGLGGFGTRTLLIPSGDQCLYAVDLLTAGSLWTFPSGAPISQAPLVTGEDVFVLNEAGVLTLLDPVSGDVRWSIPTEGGKFLSASGAKLYIRSYNHDLYVIDRASGKVLADPAATLQRAGLNLREFDLSFLNRFDDRIYLGTSSGMVICLHELGQTQPRLLRDPKALPFGYIPPEGLKPTPPAVPSAPTEPGTEPTENPPKEDAAPAPAPEGDAAP